MERSRISLTEALISTLTLGFLKDLKFYRDNAFYTSLNRDLDLGPEEIVDLGTWIEGILNLYLEQKLIRYRSLNLFANSTLPSNLTSIPTLTSTFTKTYTNMRMPIFTV